MLRLLLPVAALAFTIYCLLDIALTPRDRVRKLTKLGWFVPVLLLPLIGGVAWLLFGRPGTDATPGGGGSERGARRPDQPRGPQAGGRPPPGPSSRPRGPDDDPGFLRRLDERLRRDDDR